jgi:hypothetical protein
MNTKNCLEIVGNGWKWLDNELKGEVFWDIQGAIYCP